ncbi:popeye domain-containing protein 3 isoform X2 [Manis javanica]|uniref:popeye domain-containing protein 3 isoform X2 n=1 Tax=Manis javanica TaxID=9974 RepID=UPI003C6D29DF
MRALGFCTAVRSVRLAAGFLQSWVRGGRQATGSSSRAAAPPPPSPCAPGRAPGPVPARAAEPLGSRWRPRGAGRGGGAESADRSRGSATAGRAQRAQLGNLRGARKDRDCWIDLSLV